jgi:hypothetical protein
MVSEEEALREVAKERMMRNAIEYMPQKPIDADRVKELHYTSNQEGFYDRTLVNEQNQIVGVERTPGDIPQTLKDEYWWLVNKNYALGVIDLKDQQIDDINVKLGFIFHNAQKPKHARTVKEVADQHNAMMIHESQITMAKGGFNRQVASTITQVQGQFFKMGKNIKDVGRAMYEDLRGGEQ